MFSVQMYTKNLSQFFIQDHFYNSVGVSLYQRFAVCHHREFANLNVIAFFFCLFLCQTDAGNFRIKIDTGWDSAVIHFMISFTTNVCHCNKTFVGCGMCQHNFSIDITDGIDIRNICMHMTVCLDCFFLKFDADALCIQPVGICHTSDRHQYHFCLYSFLFSVVFINHAVIFYFLYFCTVAEYHTVFLHTFFRHIGYFFIYHWQDVIHQLQNGYFGTKV